MAYDLSRDPVNMYDISALSYDPTVNPDWFTRALFGGRLIAGGHVRVLTGIKEAQTLGMLDLNGKVLQADGRNCKWTPEQILKLSEKEAKVKTYKINLEQCIDDLENKRTAYLLNPGAMNESLPSDLENATLFILSVELSNEIEEMIVAGDSTANPNEIDGMYTILKNSTESIKITGVALTAANILEEIAKVYDAIPEEVLQNEERGTIKIFISYASQRRLRQALDDVRTQRVGVSWSYNTGDDRNPSVSYLGVEIVPTKGLDNSTIIAADSSNLIFCTDLMSDIDRIELGNFPKPNEAMIFIKGRLRLGFVIPFEDECVIYSPEV